MSLAGVTVVSDLGELIGKASEGEFWAVWNEAGVESGGLESDELGGLESGELIAEGREGLEGLDGLDKEAYSCALCNALLAYRDIIVLLRSLRLG